MSELGIIIAVATAVATLIYGLSSRTVRRHLRPGWNVITRWSAYWPWLAAFACAMFASFLLLADNYGAAQLARDPATFQQLVPVAQRRLYVATAVFDLMFSVVYGSVALLLLPVARKWKGGYRKFASLGCGLLMFAASADMLENVKMLQLLSQLPGVDRADVQKMAIAGSIKWAFAYFGSVLVFLAALTHSLWAKGETRTRTQVWLRAAAVPYVAYLIVLSGFVVAAALHQRWAFAALVPALLICGSWLNEKVWVSRKGESSGAPSYGGTRVRLSVAQMGVGACLLASGAIVGGTAGDVAAFLGLALILMSLGSFLSELRRSLHGARPVWSGLLAASIVLLSVAALLHSPELMLGCAAVGVVAGELATELASESFLRTAHSRRRRYGQLAVGSAAVTAAGAFLIAHDVDPLHALGLVAFLGVVVLMATADGDALLVVLILTLALVASTRPGLVQPDEELDAVPGEPYILVLGDSYTSGEGANEYLEGTNQIVHVRSKNDPRTNECRQAPTAWPFQLARKVSADEFTGSAARPPIREFPRRVLFLACSGAVTENIADEPRVDDKGQHGPDLLALARARIRQLGQPPEAVIVGIGGNDAGFGDIGSTCIAPGNCAEVADVFLRTRHLIDPSRPEAGYVKEPKVGWPEALSQIDDDLRGTYTSVRRVVGSDVPIVATGYPLPLTTTTDRCADTLLDADERRFINKFASELNATIARTAAAEGVYFLDLSDALSRQGSQLCARGPGSAGVNFLAFGSKGGTLLDSLSPKNWMHNSLHPTPSGHAAMAGTAHEWFGEHWPLPVPYTDAGNALAETAVRPQVEVQQCDRTRETCSVENSAWTKSQAMRLYRQSLLPIALITLGLWSVLLPFAALGRNRDDPDLRRFNLLHRWQQI